MADDPYKFFRIEAREIHDGLAQGIAQLETGPASSDLVARLLRLAHTLKGASRVVKQATIAESAHAIEDVLAPLRPESTALSAGSIGELRRLLAAIASAIEALGGGGNGAGRAGDRARSYDHEAIQTIRVEIGDLDQMAETVSELGTQLAMVRQAADRMEHLRRLADMLGQSLSRPHETTNGNGAGHEPARSSPVAEELRSNINRLARGLDSTLDHAERALAETRERVGRLRLLPVSSLFPALERAACDAAQALHKQVEFSAAGGENRIDGYALGLVRDALLQVVNNAVAHGIEDPQARAAAHKPPSGRIRLEVRRSDNRIRFVCSDDGGGIDADTVRRAAIARGVISPAEAASLSPDETIALVLRAGVTTSQSVNEVAGRGVGLDLMRECAARLSGRLEIRTERGRGTAVELAISVALSSLRALIVETEGAIASIPLESVASTGRAVGAQLADCLSGKPIIVDGQAIPFLPLAEVLEKHTDSRRRRAWPFVVIRSGAALVALGADRLRGVATIVARPLPSAIESNPAIAGVSFDLNGAACPVLEGAALVAAAARPRKSKDEAAAAPRPPVMIVDDSLTTRMLERSILESAGYAVAMATSGEQALEIAHRHPPSLFVVDVEMPGMSGFDLLARIRGDTTLNEIPAIIVSSRDGAEDHQRGTASGAQGYIVKGEFDERHLLDTIRGLIG